MNRINVFIAYQLISVSTERSEVSAVLARACEEAEADLNQGSSIRVALDPVFLDLSTSTQTLQQISAGLAAADLCVFELSDSVDEVLFGT